MTLGTWRGLCILALAIIFGLLIVLGAFINKNVTLAEQYESEQNRYEAEHEAHVETVKESYAALKSALSSVENASRVNFFLDQGLRMQQVLETLDQPESKRDVKRLSIGGPEVEQ